MLRRTLATTISAALASGCVAQIPREGAAPPPTKPVYYVAEIGFSSDEEHGSVDNSVEALADDAGRVLRKGIKVAFQPPDACMNTDAAPEGADKDDYIRMTCGVLMSSLEKVTAKAGYQVISWQGLKDAAHRPLEKAKKLDVDVLFEVNQLSANRRISGAQHTESLSFHTQSNLSDRAPLEIDDDLALRCKNTFDATLAKTGIDVREKSATLDVKAVHVKSGRAVWYYQKTVQDEADAATGPTRDFYFPATAEQARRDTRPRGKYNSKQKTGVGLLGGGGGLTLIGLAGIGANAAGPSSRPQQQRNVGYALSGVLLVGGLAMLAVGTVLLLKGNKSAREYNNAGPATDGAPTPTSLLPPAETLCLNRDVQPEFLATEPLELGPEEPADKKSSFQFKSTQSGSEDAERRERERLFRLVADDFTVELANVAGS